MNFFKKIIARLTMMESSSFAAPPQDPLDDPRTNLLTRGRTEKIDAMRKFNAEQERERILAMERQAVQVRRAEEQKNKRPN